MLQAIGHPEKGGLGRSFPDGLNARFADFTHLREYNEELSGTYVGFLKFLLQRWAINDKYLFPLYNGPLKEF